MRLIVPCGRCELSGGQVYIGDAVVQRAHQGCHDHRGWAMLSEGAGQIVGGPMPDGERTRGVRPTDIASALLDEARAVILEYDDAL